MTETVAPGALIHALKDAVRGLTALPRGYGSLDCAIRTTGTADTCTIQLHVCGLKSAEVEAATPPLPWGAPIEWMPGCAFPRLPRADGLDVNTAHARLAGIAVFARIADAARALVEILRPRAAGVTVHTALDTLYVESYRRNAVSCRLAVAGTPFLDDKRAGASSMLTSGTLREWRALVRSAAATARSAGPTHTIRLAYGPHRPDARCQLPLAVRASSAEHALRLALRLGRAAARAGRAWHGEPLLVEDLRGPDGAVPACALLGGGPLPWVAPWSEPRRRRPKRLPPPHRRPPGAVVSCPQGGPGRTPSP